MNKNKRQTISEVAIIILNDMDNRLQQVNELDSIEDIKNEISELRNFIATSKSILKLIERVNQNNIDTKNEQ